MQGSALPRVQGCVAPAWGGVGATAPPPVSPRALHTFSFLFCFRGGFVLEYVYEVAIFFG